MNDTAAREFVIELAVALHAYGTPAHRLESALSGLASTLELEAQFFTTPTQLMVGFGPTGDQRAVMVRVEPGEIDLGKLAALDALADAVASGQLDMAEGLDEVREIVDAKPRYGAPSTVLAFALTSAAVARFFDGGLNEMGVAGVIGLAIGALAIVFTRRRAGARVFELVAACVAAMIAMGVVHTGLVVSFHVSMLAGLIVLIPGLTLTVAMTEIATRNLVSGTARFTAALIAFLEIAFGVALGEHLITRMFGATAVVHGPTLPGWTEPIALLVAALSIAVLFRAHPRAVLGIVLSCSVAYYGARFGAWLLGPELGASVGAFAVAASANAWARYAHRPAMVMLVPGILLLVPGSLGFRSLSSMLERDVVTGIDTAFSMVIVAVSLVAGLLVANAAVPPRRNL